MNPQTWIFFGIGLFTIVCAALDVDWFMTHRKARFFVQMFGRDGTRVFYVVLGVAVAVGGFFICN